MHRAIVWKSLAIEFRVQPRGVPKYFPASGMFHLTILPNLTAFPLVYKEANGRLLPRDPFSRMERVPTEKQATADLDIRRRGPWRNLEAAEFATLSGTSPA